MVGRAYVVLIGQLVGLGHLFGEGGEPSGKLSPPLSLGGDDSGSGSR